MSDQRQHWPALPVSDWEPTYDTLHMYTQIIGKISLALRPMTNHWWQVALEPSARGLRTAAIPHAAGTFELDLDLVDHVLHIDTEDGRRRTVGLGRSVRDVYTDTMTALDDLGRPVPIWTRPVEVVDPIPFDKDTVHSTYEPAQVEQYWHVMCQVEGIFDEFRARFTGKASPVQFYWGSFDLATTRYSGRPADPPPNADTITRFSYTAEQSSFGFWPGGKWLNGTRVEQPLFYSYTYPQPPGISDQPVSPASAYFDADLGEFVLSYDDVRRADDPRQAILDFAQSTYEAGARLQHWPREVLEWTPPMPPSHRRAMSMT
ncbi:DUF5996 family protein [Dactylosporangium darangshiense]|uniref:DUF5996 family protein n=1 Tax=Dactylosporangium darangshiense TaxID=579108 RepID=A0ABP8DD63_9ACTN